MINNTSELFSLTCQRDSCILWFLNELKLIHQILIGFVASFDFILILIMPWDMFSLYHTPIRPPFVFQDEISILVMSCVVTRFASDNLTMYGKWWLIIRAMKVMLGSRKRNVVMVTTFFPLLVKGVRDVRGVRVEWSC